MKTLLPAPLRMAVLGSTMVLALTSCGGGGGDSDTGGGGGGTDVGETSVWRVEANVSADGCRERISNVNQTFAVTRNADDTVTVNDALVSLTGPATEDGFTVGFNSASGECVREYETRFSGVTDTTALVNLTAKTTCGANVCINQWAGTATNVTAPAAAGKDEEEFDAKVSGENCVPPIPQVGFRPSLYQCFGNAAVLARDFVRGNYSIVLRRNGEFNDRDPQNTGCGASSCSPYKTQQKIELPEYQVNCMGETGFGPKLSLARRISVKFTAQIENKNDPRQFEQYCLNSTTTNLN